MIYYKTKNYVYFLKNQWHKSDWEGVKDAWTWLSPTQQNEFCEWEEVYKEYGSANDPTTVTRKIGLQKFQIDPQEMSEEMFETYLKLIIKEDKLGADLAPNPRNATLTSAVLALAKKYKLEVKLKKENSKIILEFPNFWFQVSFYDKIVILERSDFSNFRDLKFVNIKYLIYFIENTILITR